jgi:hypothetical protein
VTRAERIKAQVRREIDVAVVIALFVRDRFELRALRALGFLGFALLVTGCGADSFTGAEGGSSDDASADTSTDDSGETVKYDGAVDGGAALDAPADAYDAGCQLPKTSGTTACKDALGAWCTRFAACCTTCMPWVYDSGACITHYAGAYFGQSDCSNQKFDGLCIGNGAVCASDLLNATCSQVFGADPQMISNNCAAVWTALK